MTEEQYAARDKEQIQEEEKSSRQWWWYITLADEKSAFDGVIVLAPGPATAYRECVRHGFNLGEHTMARPLDDEDVPTEKYRYRLLPSMTSAPPTMN